MKKLSIIFLITLSLILTSCFKKKEVKVTESPKTIINNTIYPIESSTWTIEKEKFWTWKTENKLKTSTWVIENENKNFFLSRKLNKINNEEIFYIGNNYRRYSNSIYYTNFKEVYCIDWIGPEWWFSIKKIEWVKYKDFSIILPDKDYKWLPIFWTDNNNLIYWCEIVNKWNPQGFKFINEHKYHSNKSYMWLESLFWWDQDNLYFWDNVFHWWDRNSLEKLWDNCYKDKNNLYCKDFFIRHYISTNWYDKDSFNYIGNNYFKDNKNVYYLGSFTIDKKNENLISPLILSWADINSFKVINNLYTKDNKNVYYEWKIIQWADSSSFEIINQIIAQDKNYIYNKWEIFDTILNKKKYPSFSYLDYKIENNEIYYKSLEIKWADINSFNVINQIYSKDKNNVYYNWYIIQWANPNSFEFIKWAKNDVSHDYTKDSNWVYYKWKKIDWADPVSIVFVTYYHYKDKNNVYYEWKIMPWVDSKSFVEETNGAYVKDKNYLYSLRDWFRFDWIDPNNFKEIFALNFWWVSYVLDPDTVYCEYKKIDVDVNSFTVFDDYPDMARDKNNVYYRCDKINDIVIDTFVYLWNGQYKNLNKIYSSWKIIESADVDSYKVINHIYSKDKNNVYFNWEKVDKILDSNTFTISDWIYQDNICVYKIGWNKATCTPKDSSPNSEFWKIKLINAYLSDETEEVDENTKLRIKETFPETDINTLVKFKNSIYYKDKNSVFWDYRFINKIKWVKPNEFKVLQPDGDYWYDWKNIYLIWRIYNWIDLKTLKFGIIDKKYVTSSAPIYSIAWDNNNLYFWYMNTFTWGSINSLKYVSQMCFKDNLNVYCLPNYGFWIEKFWDWYEIIKWADPDSFVDVGEWYVKDKNFLYNLNYWVNNNKIEWIQDINSFIIINYIPQDNKCTYKIDWTTATCTPK